MSKQDRQGEQRSIVPVSQATWQTIQSIAPVAQASRMFGVNQEQAAIVMLKGHELQLGLASAFEFIHVIDGRPSISPKGALALIHQSGKLEEMKIDEETDECTVYMKRTNGFSYNATFSMADAKRAGLLKSGSSWETYPANMLRWRAIGYCADIVFPDVVGGLYRPEELGATVGADGAPLPQVIEGEAQVIKEGDEEPITPAEAKPKPEVGGLTIDALLERGHTAEEILAANEGRIPATSAECEQVLETLEATTDD